MQKILIFGSQGLLGRALCRNLTSLKGVEVLGLNHQQADITNQKSVSKIMADFSPKFVINSAAYTNVDKAETDRETCVNVNVLGAENVAKAVAISAAQLIHISTASVFNSLRIDLIPKDSPFSPSNYYSETKAKAETSCKNILANTDQLTIFRTYWLYGENKKNFVSFLRQQLAEDKETQVVEDQYGQPTFTNTVIQAITYRIQGHIPNGTYPATNSGITSRFDWAESICKSMKKSKSLLKRVNSTEFPAAAQRPFNASLDHADWDRFGVKFRDWESELQQYAQF